MNNREEEEAEQKEYGSGCKHVVTDEDQGMIFCVECGIVTQDQILKSGGGICSYSMYRKITPKEKRPKRRDQRGSEANY